MRKSGGIGKEITQQAFDLTLYCIHSTQQERLGSPQMEVLFDDSDFYGGVILHPFDFEGDSGGCRKCQYHEDHPK